MLKSYEEFIASGACDICGSNRCDSSPKMVGACGYYRSFIGESKPQDEYWHLTKQLTDKESLEFSLELLKLERNFIHETSDQTYIRNGRLIPKADLLTAYDIVINLLEVQLTV